MSESKKRKNENETYFKRKKVKAKKFSDDNLSDPIPKVEDTNSEDLSAELLSAQTVREGMLLLGCVIEIKSTFFVMSLPGYLTGVVQANNISDAFTKSLTDFTSNTNPEDIEPSIDSIIKIGMVFPCKVVQILKNESKRRTEISLSINPQDVNAELRPSSVYSKMVLYVSVCSLEDHGYIVDAGSKYIQAFLPMKDFEHGYEANKIGEVIPTYVKKIVSSDKHFAKIQLSQLDFNEDFPDVTADDIKLSSLLPGARIHLDVIEMKYPFVFMKYLYFEACASVLSLGRAHKSIKIGSTILGTVLYVHPVTHMIYVMLSLKPSPIIFDGYFGLRKFELVHNLKFEGNYKNRAYFKLNKATHGFIMSKHLPDKGQDPSGAKNISKACIVSFHYMDNLLQMSAKPSLVEQPIIYPESVQIGDVYEAVVMKHVNDGMFVRICPGLQGFVRRIHMSDVYVTKPELLHALGSKVKCRVLFTDGEGKLNLTCKESLVNLEERYVLSSYENAQCGQFYKGVIVKKTDTYFLVLFFNNVKGIVTSSQVPRGSVFYEGQLVLCEVLKSIPSKKKLMLSLDTQGWCSIEELEDVWDEVVESNDNKKSKKIVKASSTPQSNSQSVNELKKIKILSSKDESKIKCTESSLYGPVEAIIKNVKGSQLNIIVNKARGRVHITQLGCTREGVYPLREFSPGQKISVNVIGEYKKKNFLKITHKNVYLKECSLNLPSVTLSEEFKIGSSLIGFVKEVGNFSAVLWLSPSETGVLDFLHFSENQNPKEVKKVQRSLKVGMSLHVSILEKPKCSDKEKSTHGIILTKIERKHPEVGKNVLGLVQICCVERGLILKLPFGYHGVAAVTDLSDVYTPVQSLLDKCYKSKFVLCHILEVNHQTKYCQVSLRKSRLYSMKISRTTSFCPEILLSNVKEGDTVKGFVKAVSKSSLNVIFGRNLEGKVALHNCSISGCSTCSITKNILSKYPVGNVIEVDIEKIEAGGSSCILNLFNSRNEDNSSCKRLSIKDDISWDEEEE